MDFTQSPIEELKKLSIIHNELYSKILRILGEAPSGALGDKGTKLPENTLKWIMQSYDHSLSEQEFKDKVKSVGRKYEREKNNIEGDISSYDNYLKIKTLSNEDKSNLLKYYKKDEVQEDLDDWVDAEKNLDPSKDTSEIYDDLDSIKR